MDSVTETQTVLIAWLSVKAMRLGNAWCFENIQRFDLATVAFSQQALNGVNAANYRMKSDGHCFFAFGTGRALPAFNSIEHSGTP